MHHCNPPLPPSSGHQPTCLQLQLSSSLSLSSLGYWVVSGYRPSGPKAKICSALSNCHPVSPPSPCGIGHPMSRIHHTTNRHTHTHHHHSSRWAPRDCPARTPGSCRPCLCPSAPCRLCHSPSTVTPCSIPLFRSSHLGHSNRLGPCRRSCHPSGGDSL